ncbi:MAG: hypothetical protein HC886_10705 [Leptolyngbyaceae cyanobacterium SM1_1_3]|nr:hypothetical protein [Leptolyngbyaceae cyanobacterium SM1_1_3]NJN03896.1 hypothetical protein [Leptolyngbyaceae cyanobacterium RM1_1_2]NJO09005.1 hypothetical protein [Leptolyngbyaceae cyanobacterium SL_1_1]
MSDKRKVTLYISPDLHRQLRVQSALDGEAMSAIAERALDFYLAHSEVVDGISGSPDGHSHQVYSCPQCATSVVVRDGDLVSLANQPTIEERELPNAMQELVTSSNALEDGKLVPC